MTVPPEGAILDRRTLNRTLLARQHLLQPTTAGPAAVIEHLVGMQAQVPRDPYIGLWSRLSRFDPESVETLLLERQAVRMTLMRTTLHLVTAGDARQLRPVMQAVCERGFGGSPFAKSLRGVDVGEVVRDGAALLAGRPLTVAELGRELVRRWPDRDPAALAYAVRYLVPVVQVPPRGLFRMSGAPRLMTLDAWLASRAPTTATLPVGAESPADGLADAVILRYLRAFGPATVADISAWSWLTGVRQRLQHVLPSLRRYRDEAGRDLLDVADGAIADGTQAAPVRFLGEYDNVFLSHADRSRITGDLHWGTAYARVGSFFVDGFLAGAWRIRSDDPRRRLVVEPRRVLSTAERRDVIDEAERLRTFLSTVVPIREVSMADA